MRNRPGPIRFSSRSPIRWWVSETTGTASTTKVDAVDEPVQIVGTPHSFHQVGAGVDPLLPPHGEDPHPQGFTAGGQGTPDLTEAHQAHREVGQLHGHAPLGHRLPPPGLLARHRQVEAPGEVDDGAQGVVGHGIGHAPAAVGQAGSHLPPGPGGGASRSRPRARGSTAGGGPGGTPRAGAGSRSRRRPRQWPPGPRRNCGPG